jgi:hypothetical protein
MVWGVLNNFSGHYLLSPLFPAIARYGIGPVLIALLAHWIADARSIALQKKGAFIG